MTSAWIDRAGRLALAWLCLATAPAIAADETHWNALSARGYSQCLSRMQCCAGPECVETELIIGDSCGVSCSSSGCTSSIVALVDPPNYDFVVAGGTGFTGGGCKFCPAAEGLVRGRILTPGTLTLTYRQTVSAYGGPPPRLHVGVFHYHGDPRALDGLDADTVSDLVTLGLIGPEDILYSASPIGEFGVIEVTIDIAGIPESEIVVFGAGRGIVADPCPSEVPATGPWGALVLAGALAAALAAARAAARRR
jgi:hypothetical protein